MSQIRIRVLKDSMEDAQGALDLALDAMADAIRMVPGLKPFLSPHMESIAKTVKELPLWIREIQ